MIFVFEQGKVELTVEALAKHLGEFLRFRVIVDTDGEDLHFVFTVLSQEIFQLPELLDAIGSPMSAVKNEDDGFLAAKIR